MPSSKSDGKRTPLAGFTIKRYMPAQVVDMVIYQVQAYTLTVIMLPESLMKTKYPVAHFLHIKPNPIVSEN